MQQWQVEHFYSNGEESLLIHNQQQGHRVFQVLLHGHVDTCISRRLLYDSTGKDSIELGVSIGNGPLEETLSKVEKSLEGGARRVKLKVKPGSDRENGEIQISKETPLGVTIDTEKIAHYTLHKVEVRE